MIIERLRTTKYGNLTLACLLETFEGRLERGSIPSLIKVVFFESQQHLAFEESSRDLTLIIRRMISI